MSEHLLELEDIECRYGEHVVISELSLRVRKGNLVCLLGPSGCGKSTILRAIAGLEPIYDGQIKISDEVVSTRYSTKPPEKRQLGMVFQDYALFPHMNIEDNICFGVRSLPRQEKRKLSQKMLEKVGLLGMETRFPHELSGGQQQRVALARALVVRPKLILFDEPFSNLDIELREKLSLEVKQILKDENLTGIMVTHDQSEAFAVADMIGVIHDKKLQQWDNAYNLYHDPVNRFVADFIGQGRFIPGRMASPDTADTELGLLVGDRAYEWAENTEVDILIRPDDITPDETSNLRAEVTQKAFKGSEILYTIQLNSDSELLAAFPSHFDYFVGDDIGIQLDLHHLIAFRK